MPSCINLRQQFGRLYRITREPAHAAEYGRRSRTDDPWLQMIPGSRGHIYPHGGELLAVSTNKRGGTARRILALPGVVAVQDGDDGLNATFPVELLTEVADLIRAFRRRQPLTPEQRARLAAAGAATRFNPGTRNHESDLESTIGIPVDIPPAEGVPAF